MVRHLFIKKIPSLQGEWIKINDVKFKFRPKIKPIYAIVLSLGVIVTIVLSNVLNNNQVVNKSVETSMNIDGITNDKSKEIIDILKECGLNDISSIEHDELLDNAHLDGEKGYRVNNDSNYSTVICRFSEFIWSYYKRRIPNYISKRW